MRKVILRVLLASLAFAALAGVVAVVFTSEAVARVMVTGFITAAAALCLLPLSRMVDRKDQRSAGLLGTVAVVVEFILVLMLIWEVLDVVIGGRQDQHLWMTVAAVAAATGPAMLCLLGLARKDARVAGAVGLALTAAFFVTAMIGAWTPRTVAWQWWATAGAIAFFGAMAGAALFGAGTRDGRHWRWLGVVSAAIGAALLIVTCWSGEEDWQTFSLFTAVGLYVGYANLIVRVPLKRGQGWLRTATLIAAAATAVMSVAIVYGQNDDLVIRGHAAVAILACCGTLALAVLARLNRRVDYEPVSREMREVTLVCPNCRKKQTVGVGGAACTSCGLRIHVRIEEPRCTECGYLLYMLTSSACPECGAPIGNAPVAAS